jgi:glycosyltransferase involved in cell wall biosynthesis
VSVVIASFNHARFVGESIASVAAQTYPRLELIVVDDGSTDDSVAVVDQSLECYAPRFERCCFIRQRHRGMARTPNRGVRLARGEFVSFLDSDDVYMSHKIETLLAVDAWRDDRTAVVVGDAGFIDERSRPVAVRPDLKPDEVGYTSELRFHRRGLPEPPANAPLGSYLSLIERSYVPDSAALIRRDRLFDVGLYDPRLLPSDWELWLKLARRWSIVFVDCVVSNKRWHQNNTSQVEARRIYRDCAGVLSRERRYCCDGRSLATWRASFARMVNAVLVTGTRRDLLFATRRGNPGRTAMELMRIRGLARGDRRAKIAADG